MECDQHHLDGRGDENSAWFIGSLDGVVGAQRLQSADPVGLVRGMVLSIVLAGSVSIRQKPNKTLNNSCEKGLNKYVDNPLTTKHMHLCESTRLRDPRFDR